MPQYASEAQRKMMHAIKAGKGDASKTARKDIPPVSVARDYSGGQSDTDSKGQEHNGGKWGEHHNTKRRKHKHDRKQAKKKLHKAFEDFYKAKAAATLVMDKDNRILLGRHKSGGLSFPGGHVEMNETPDQAALRELKEEAGIEGKLEGTICTTKIEGNECTVFLTSPAHGKPHNTDEMSNFMYYNVADIPWNDLRDCCIEPLKTFVENKLGKTLAGMIAIEKLQKNIIRSKGEAVFEVTHGDALRLIGSGLFKLIMKQIEGMQDEDIRDFNLADAKVFIRKHMNDVYSGRVEESGTMTYEFKNQSLPQITAALMSVFEWYEDKDSKSIISEDKIKDIIGDETITDDVIAGGLEHMDAKDKKNAVGAIYEEMRNIREEIRHDSALDIQGTETRIMKLFDKLEHIIHNMVNKHNELANEADKELEEIERKLRDLQNKLDEMAKKPNTIEAYQPVKVNPDKVYNQMYHYLPKPVIEISPCGKIKITFGEAWQDMEKEDFLRDLRAKVIQNKK